MKGIHHEYTTTDAEVKIAAERIRATVAGQRVSLGAAIMPENHLGIRQMDTTARKTPELEKAFIEIDTAILRAEGLLASLSSRLQPALGKRSHGEAGKGNPTIGYSSPLASDLSDKADHIERLNSCLADLLENLEI